MSNIIKCENLLGERCKLDGEICHHLVYDGNCLHAKTKTITKPSFRDCLEILNTGIKKKSKIRYNTYNFNAVIKNTDLTWDCPIEDFTYEKAEELINNTRAKYSDYTIATILNAVYSVSNPQKRLYYKAKNFKVPTFERYQFKIHRKTKTELTWEQKNEIMYRMETYRRNALNENLTANQRSINRNYFIALWLGVWFGIRDGDVNRMKWGNITYINGIPHIKFNPHKTQDTTNVEVRWPINDTAFNQIKSFMGGPDDTCLTVNEKYMSKRIGEKRENVGIHRSLFRNLNKFFRSIGVTGWGAFYALRYMNSQETYKLFGVIAEEMKMGHSIRTGQTSYYNKHDHSMKIM